MTSLNKKFRLYVILASIYSLGTIFYVYTTNTLFPLNAAWLSDKFYIFQFCTIYCVGLSFVTSLYTYPYFFRFKNKVQAILSEFYAYLIVGFIWTTIFFTILISFHILVCDNIVGNIWLYEILIKYVKYYLGCVSISCVSILFRSIFKKNIHSQSHLITYIAMAFEIFILRHILKAIFNRNIYLFFCWIVYGKTTISIPVLFILNIAIICLFIRLTKNRDIIF